MKRYSDLIKLKTFDERLDYLMLYGKVSEETFGVNRWRNQRFYMSREWQKTRSHILTRDMGCDMALYGFEVFDKGIVHHLNPITIDDVKYRPHLLLDPENLVMVSHDTHNTIHYGKRDAQRVPLFKERRPGDQCPWIRY